MNCFIIATAIVSAREKGCSFKVNPFFPGFCAFVFFFVVQMNCFIITTAIVGAHDFFV